MKTEIGEYIVGAWLKEVKECDFVVYNVRPPVDGLKGLGELDVVGLDLKNKAIFICEVVTHINGMGYKDFKTTEVKVREKFSRQQQYATDHLPKDFKKYYMLWSPIVTPKYVKAIEGNRDLELVINDVYSKKIEEIQKAIKGRKKDFGNPFVRALQILEVLQCSCGSGRKFKKCHGK